MSDLERRLAELEAFQDSLPCEAVTFGPEWRQRIGDLRPDQSCGHPGCLSHVSHPCEGCGRIGGLSKGAS